MYEYMYTNTHTSHVPSTWLRIKLPIIQSSLNYFDNIFYHVLHLIRYYKKYTLQMTNFFFFEYN